MKTVFVRIFIQEIMAADNRGLGRVPKELLDEVKDVPQRPQHTSLKHTSLNVRVRPGLAAPQRHSLESQMSILLCEMTGYGALIFPMRAVACTPSSAIESRAEV